jgi:predicted nucleic acid-binding protein
VAHVALEADIMIAFLYPRDDQHAEAVAELPPRLAAGDELLATATVYAETIARRAAGLRAEHPSLRLPDAMSLATAIATDSTLLTLDKKLRHVARRAQPSSTS